VRLCKLEWDDDVAEANRFHQMDVRDRGVKPTNNPLCARSGLGQPHPNYEPLCGNSFG
jgi:hypothetical protein